MPYAVAKLDQTYLFDQVRREVSLAQVLDGTVNPGLVLQCDHLVTENTLTFMNPESQQVTVRRAH